MDKSMKQIQTNFTHKTPKNISQLLESNATILEHWNKLTPLARNEWICWVTIMKKEKTRKEHLERMREDMLKGKKRPCCWPGCPHRRPNAQKWFKLKLQLK